MTSFEIKGWCPGALRPMMSGDGLVVRIRPRLGQFSRAQAHVIAQAARDFGSGVIDLSSRANLQLRGVRPEGHPALIAALDKAGLIDANPQIETRRNIVVTPFRDAAGRVNAIAAALELALARSDLDLPGKFGFAVDCGTERVLDAVSCDIRIEADASGKVLVRAEGADLGVPVDASDAAAVALEMARWFIESGGAIERRGRMGAHLRRGVLLPQALRGSARPAPVAPKRAPGLIGEGALVAVAFGSMHVDVFEQLAEYAPEMRITPWRMIFLPEARAMPTLPGLIAEAHDPLLRVEACSGAPWCPQAYHDTRELARRLAQFLPSDATLHVSGCAKGCACVRPATITLVANAGGFDIVANGTASSPPERKDISLNEIEAHFERYVGGL